VSTSGFRSAELGVLGFTFTSSCSPKCNPTTGHARDCGANVVYAPGTFYLVPAGPMQLAPATIHVGSCPHCGGSLVNGIAAAVTIGQG